jgi:geranylgeranyl pyrophosphate synthase
MTTGTLRGDARVRKRLEAWREQVDGALAGLGAVHSGDDAVSAAVRYAIDGGGKRLRPILCLAAADVSAPEQEATSGGRVLAAAAVELIHTYSLVHDDLPCMDDDDLRRGRPTVHVVFGSAAAVLAGVALIPLAARTLLDACEALEVEGPRRERVLLELCRGAGAAGMVGGQVLDLEAEGRPLTLPQLESVHAMKTGALFRASARIGARIASAPEEGVDALDTFAARVGLAFQITDDVLDVTMDAHALGKTPGKDVGASKVTFVSLLGVDAARRRARDEADAAVAALHAAGVDSPVLRALAGFAVDRDR